MKKWLIKKFFKFYEGKVYEKLDSNKIDRMFNYLAKKEETRDFGRFFRQCADDFKNRYLYTNDDTLKGAILVSLQLAEKFEEHTPKKKKENKEKMDRIVGNKNLRIKY